MPVDPTFVAMALLMRPGSVLFGAAKDAGEMVPVGGGTFMMGNGGGHHNISFRCAR